MLVILLLIVIIVLIRKPREVRKAEKQKAHEEFINDLNHALDKTISKVKGNK